MFPKLEKNAILAPMAAVTDVAFRVLCRRLGAAYSVTELISVYALVNGNEISRKMCQRGKGEEPFAIQLFGEDLDVFVKAAKLVEKQCDIIDINLGCPALKIMKQGAGAALCNPEKVGKMVARLKKEVSLPITIKIRTGADENSINAVEVAKSAEKAGAAAIGIHARTVEQKYAGDADWSVIKDVVDNVKIPVLGNGDIRTPEDFKRMLDETGCAAVMIGRAARDNPSLFKQIKEYCKTGTYKELSEKEKLEHFFQYYELWKEYNVNFNLLKLHAMNFTKNIERSKEIRAGISKCSDESSLVAWMKINLRKGHDICRSSQ